MSRSTNSKRI